MPRRIDGKLLAKGLMQLANCMHDLAPLVNETSERLVPMDSDLVAFDRALAKAARKALKEAARAHRKA